MKQKLAALLAVLAVLLAACGPAAGNSGSSGSTQSSGVEKTPMEEDLDLFTSTLEENHKNLYANISKEEFQAEVEQVRAELPGMSEGQFYYSLRRLLSLVGDAHTSLGFTDSNYRHLTALPFAVMYFEDGWHLMMLEEQNQQYLGYRLLAIDGTPIDEVYAKAKTIMSYENESWARQQFSNTINFLDALKYLGIVGEDADSITLTIQKGEGSPEETLPLKGMNEEEIFAAAILQVERRETPATAARGYYRTLDLGDGAFFLQYNTCQEAEDLPMAEFVELTSDALCAGQYTKVILDLRYNTGGDSRIFEPMIEKLGELKEQQGFQVYVLIGRNTFSSAIINSIQAQEALDAVLVGEQTGGSVNGYGELQSFQLKNTPIQVYYSTKYFELIPGYDKDSLYPDQPVAQTYADYVAGVDPEVQAILGRQ
ncbi:hypothetical protein LQE96_02555 [Phocea massiliensis]|uniref:hypothetical protein n=1 Tax=Merdimmobilis hominis TaxID=2897707 RepID=UPI001E43A308|nr:hypothetical protein [Merdimmobilis hominis]MCD4835715.1 hypothetical protein [Merdimmobilis hominis]